MIEIAEKSTRKGIKEFIDLSWEIYRNDPNWVPPLRNDLLNTLLGKDNGLFVSGSHAFFMAYDDDVPVARLCVGINEELNKKKGRNDGYICLFECVKNYNTAFVILDKAADWLKERGMTGMRGPCSPTNGDDYKGMLVEGFDGPPVLMNSYNPEYYKDFFEKYGFEKEIDLYAYYYDAENIDVAKYNKIIDYAMKRYNFHVDRIDLDNLDKELLDIKRILDIAMPEEWADLTPPSLEEIKFECKQLLPLVDPDLIFIARTGDEPIGFDIALPDYNQVLIRMNGRLFPFGIFKFLNYKKKINGARIFVLFVVPEFRKKAVSSSIFQKCFMTGKQKGYKYGEGSTIGETNEPMIRDAEGAGGKKYRTYRIYKKTF